MQTSSFKNQFLTLLNTRGLVKNISNFIGDLRLMHLSLICLTETHLLPSRDLSGIPTTYQIIRNDNKNDKVKSLAVLYDKSKLKCLEQKSFAAALYIKFGTTFCNLNQCNIAVLYRKKYFKYYLICRVCKLFDACPVSCR